MTKLITMQYQPLKIYGQYDSQHTFLLDNRFYNHQLGYYVITPLHLTDKNAVVLVNRGWVAQDKVASVTTPADPQNVVGYFDLPPSSTFRLSKQLNAPHEWPRIIEVLDSKELSQMLKLHVYPFVIKLLATEPYGFVRDWSIVTTMPPERHQAYAVQWFALALTVLIIFFATHCKKLESS